MTQEIIQHINQLVREGEPFLFVINYHGDKAYIRKLSEINPHECLYDFDGKTNTKDFSPNGLPSKISWKAIAPSFSDYAKSFDFVKRNIMAGNSYLTNLTCQVPIECNLSLEDVFFHSQGKYKLWMNNSDDRLGKFVCFSPETFVKIRNGRIYSYPMKGTISADLPLAEQALMEDEKEAAEHATIVKDNDIDYSFKSTDRTSLNRLANQKENCDEIIIIKNGLVTDTSFTNIAIFKDGKWLTPKHPLLLGTKRAALLEKGIIQEAEITVDDLMKAEKVSLFNAMIDFGEREVMALDIYQDEYRIREIKPSDDESILKIARSAFEEFGAPLTGSIYCDPRMEHLSNEFVREDAKYWVIEGADGEILGGGGFYPTEGLPLGMAEVVKLYLSPSLRGKGYGKKMLSLIEQEAKKVGYKELYIESFPEFVKAVRLYEKMGFKHINHALGNSGHPAVTVWMTKKI